MTNVLSYCILKLFQKVWLYFLSGLDKIRRNPFDSKFEKEGMEIAMSHIKQDILQELDSRLERLSGHKEINHVFKDNPFRQLTQVESKIIGSVLTNELTSIKKFVEKL